MTPPTLASLLAEKRYVYATTDGEAMGAYRGNRDAAERDARRVCRKTNMPVLFYEDGAVSGQLTPVAGRAMWTANECHEGKVA